MPFLGLDLLEIFTLVIWNCLDNSSWKVSTFELVLKSRVFTLSLLAAAGLNVCPGLLEVIQHPTPPSITWFESLPSLIPASVWGIYALVLRKDGCLPCLYFGSGTNYSQGVRARISNYNTNTLIPRYVRKALDDGYTITHRCLLVWCPTPSAGQVPIIRHVFVALEAALTCIFSAFKNPEKDYGFTGLFPWPRSDYDFDYQGLCSHSPFLEDVPGDLDLSPEQLEKIAAAVKEKNRQYQIEYQKNLRANPTPQYKATQQRNNEKQRPTTKARQVEAVATKQ